MSIPPGLTCGRCELPLYPELARRQGETYVHVGPCPCIIEDCERTRHSNGYCQKHYNRVIRTGSPYTERNVIELEDVEFLADTGENLIGAAERLGVKSAQALDMWLRRKGRVDLAKTLQSRNPRDWNKAADGTALVREIKGDKYLRELANRNETKRRQRQGSSAA